jgi:DNA (cytosine-5)-methyltransferase 1
MSGLRHASFFSGVGGLDLGFENAGIRTVSLCEFDPYASAVLAERFPGVPNFGDITKINVEEIPNAEVYSGGFPCQDLSTAGARRGFAAGTRSSLAFTFLDIVERRRPRWFVLENVPGLFSSNSGRDFGRLIREVGGLGYGLAWRTLDARWFGVAQRRRRVFIVAARDDAFGGLGGERAAEVLIECEGVCGHLATGRSTGEEPPASARPGVGTFGADVASAIIARHGKGINSTVEPGHIVHSATHAGGMRSVDGLAPGVDDRPRMGQSTSIPALGETYADTLAARDWKGGVANQDINRRGWLAIVRESNFGGYAEDELGATLRASGGNYGGGSENLAATERVDATIDPLNPVGLDSHRYRCIGNGVVAPVAEFIGRRIVAVDAKYWKEANG